MHMGPWEALCMDWHDGDTGHFNVDLGFDIIESAYDLDGKPRLSARIFGINAPELKAADGSGIKALDYAIEICPPGTKVIAMSHDWDKYGGRWDATIALPEPVTSVDGAYTGTDFATLMLHSENGVVLLK